MIEGIPTFITDEEVRQRAQANAENVARQQIEREHLAALAQARQNDAERLAARQQSESRAAEQLAELRPLYERRTQAAAALAKAVADFASIESEIKASLVPIERGLFRPGVDMGQQAQRLAQLRTQAGLPARHDVIGTAGLNRLAKAVIVGILNGYILDGAIMVGGRGVTIE